MTTMRLGARQAEVRGGRGLYIVVVHSEANFYNTCHIFGWKSHNPIITATCNMKNPLIQGFPN